MTTGREKGKLEGHSSVINFLFFLPDGKSLVSASRYQDDRAASIWDVESGKERRMIRMGAAGIHGMGLSRDGHMLACLCQELQGMHVRFFDPATGIEIAKIPITKLGVAGPLALSPDGKSYVFQAQDGSLVMADVARGKEPRTLRPNNFHGIPVFLPNGSGVAVIGTDGFVRLVDLKTDSVFQFGKEADPALNPNRTQQVPALAVSADGRLLATPGTNGIVLWEVASGQQRSVLTGGHQSQPLCLSFAPDGKTLVSSGKDAQIILWDLAAVSQDEKEMASKLTRKQAIDLWNNLQSDDAVKAGRAIGVLSAAHKVSFSVFSDNLTPAEVVDRKKVDKLLEDLHSEEFEERDKAQRGLEQLGDQIEPALRKALEVKPAPEVAKRIGELLRKFHDLPWSGKQLQAYRALEVLEHMRGEDAKSLMEKLAGGADGAWQTREAKAILERWQEADKK